RLPRLPHRLHDVRERMKIFADEPDDEVVVGGIEAVAREADVVGEVFGAVRAADDRVLAEDRCLLAWLELREGSAASERIPDGPVPSGVLDGALRAIEEPEREVGLVAARVGAPEHGEVSPLDRRR